MIVSFFFIFTFVLKPHLIRHIYRRFTYSMAIWCHADNNVIVENLFLCKLSLLLIELWDGKYVGDSFQQFLSLSCHFIAIFFREHFFSLLLEGYYKIMIYFIILFLFINSSWMNLNLYLLQCILFLYNLTKVAVPWHEILSFFILENGVNDSTSDCYLGWILIYS